MSTHSSATKSAPKRSRDSAADASSGGGAASSTCAALKNSAFVFVKPHANTPAVQSLVRQKLVAAGCVILSEVDIDGKTIDQNKLIDQHYYAIGT